MSRFQRRFLGWTLVGLLLLRLVMVIQVPLTDTTEARYAEMARKMVETGDWVMPQYKYGVPFLGKPPLYVWLSAAGLELFGLNEFGSRVFIFLSGLSLVAIFYRWTRTQRGGDFALLATLLLVSSGQFYIMLAGVMSDPVLLVGTTLSMMGFWSAMNPSTRHPKRWGYLFFVGLAIGLLAKGPLSIILSGVAIGGWVLWQNRWRDTWVRIPWITGTLLMLALSLPWYLIAERAHPGFLRYFIWGEHVLRFLDPGWDGDRYGNPNAEPHGFIWVYLAVSFLPWVFYLVAALCRPRRVVETFRRDTTGWLPYVCCWTVGAPLFFTPSTNILPTYILTSMPAMALLTAELVLPAGPAAEPSRRLRRMFLGTLSPLVMLFLYVYLTLSFTVNHTTKKTHKWLVATVEHMRNGAPGTLYVWNYRYYSAEFYTRGRVRQVEDADGFERILANGQRDFLSVRVGKEDVLPPGALDHFDFVARFKKDNLYVERVP